MHATKSALAVGFAATLLVALPAPSASAHVHGITPLRCMTQANANSGATHAVNQSAAGLQGGPLHGIGVIPVDMGGNVQLLSFVGSHPLCESQ
jgi:hypothetical protein